MGKLSKVLNKLDMGKEARMARAKEQGFDVDFPITHGSHERIAGIRGDGVFDGVFGSAGDVSEHGGAIQNTFIPRAGKVARGGDIDIDYYDAIDFLKSEYPEASDSIIDSLYEMVAEDANIFDMDVNPLQAYGFDDLGDAGWEGQRLRGKLAHRQDFDAIAMSDEHGQSFLLPSGTRARSINAAFDPAQKESSNLLASAAGVGVVGAGSLLTPEEAQARLNFAERRAARAPFSDRIMNQALARGGQGSQIQAPINPIYQDIANVTSGSTVENPAISNLLQFASEWAYPGVQSYLEKMAYGEGSLRNSLGASADISPLGGALDLGVTVGEVAQPLIME